MPLWQDLAVVSLNSLDWSAQANAFGELGRGSERHHQAATIACVGGGPDLHLPGVADPSGIDFGSKPTRLPLRFSSALARFVEVGPKLSLDDDDDYRTLGASFLQRPVEITMLTSAFVARQSRRSLWHPQRTARSSKVQELKGTTNRS